MFGRGYYDESAFMVLQVMQSGALFFGLIFTAILVILCFGRDRIPRPRAFNWGAILFTIAIVIPIVSATMLAIVGLMSSDSYNGGAIELRDLSRMLLGMASLLAPLLMGAGLLMLVIGMTTPFSQLSAAAMARRQSTPAGATTDHRQPPAPKEREPHPLD